MTATMIESHVRTHDGSVNLRLFDGSETISVLWDPPAARRMATLLLQYADTAEAVTR